MSENALLPTEPLMLLRYAPTVHSPPPGMERSESHSRKNLRKPTLCLKEGHSLRSRDTLCGSGSSSKAARFRRTACGRRSECNSGLGARGAVRLVAPGFMPKSSTHAAKTTKMVNCGVRTPRTGQMRTGSGQGARVHGEISLGSGCDVQHTNPPAVQRGARCAFFQESDPVCKVLELV